MGRLGLTLSVFALLLCVNWALAAKTFYTASNNACAFKGLPCARSHWTLSAKSAKDESHKIVFAIKMKEGECNQKKKIIPSIEKINCLPFHRQKLTLLNFILKSGADDTCDSTLMAISTPGSPRFGERLTHQQIKDLLTNEVNTRVCIPLFKNNNLFKLPFINFFRFSSRRLLKLGWSPTIFPSPPPPMVTSSQ